MFRKKNIIKQLLSGVFLVAILSLPACDDASENTQSKSLREKMLKKQKQELENASKSLVDGAAEITSMSLVENGQDRNITISEKKFFLELFKTLCRERKSFDSKEIQKQLVKRGYGNINLTIEASNSSKNITEMNLQIKSSGPLNVMCQSSSEVTS